MFGLASFVHCSTLSMALRFGITELYSMPPNVRHRDSDDPDYRPSYARLQRDVLSMLSVEHGFQVEAPIRIDRRLARNSESPLP